MNRLSGNRRTFLSWISRLTITGLLGRIEVLYADSGSISKRNLGSAIVEAFPSRESAAIIGREYLRCNPLEASAEFLINSLCTTITRVQLSPSSDAPNIRTWVRSRMQEDFGNGDTVLVNRWILSRSEARLYALAALKDDQPNAFYREP